MWLHYIAEAITAIAAVLAAIRSSQSHIVAKSARDSSIVNGRVISDLYSNSQPPKKEGG